MKVSGIRRITAAAIVATAAAAGAQGFGGGGPDGGPGPMMNRPPMQRTFGHMGFEGRGWWNNPRIIERLKLTDDQRKGMDSILLQHREKLVDLRANLEKAELAMQPLMDADTPNDAAIIAQIDKVVQARADLERANSRFLLAIRDKLTVDQWKQIQSLEQDGGPGNFRRGGPGPERGPRRQAPPSGLNQQQAPPPPANAPGSGAGPGASADMEE